MKILKKEISVLIVFLILLLPVISSATIVEVPQEQQKPTNFFESAFGFLKSKVLITIIVVLALIIVFLVLVFFLVRWLVQFIKKRSDIFYQLRKERIKLASTHRRYPANHWIKVHKNTPIRLVQKKNDKVMISSPIGYYKGDYITHEGNFVLSMNIIGNKMWFIFPLTDLLIIPNRSEVTIKKEKDNSETTKLPLAKDILQFNENEILIFAESISNTGMFYVPVLESKDGKIIDLTLPTYESLKNVILGDYLYTQTDEFSKLSKVSMNLNPYVRAGVKVADSSQNVEVPSGDKT